MSFKDFVESATHISIFLFVLFSLFISYWNDVKWIEL